MKKILYFALTVVLALSLVACGGGGIKDGTYTAEFKEVSYGWKDTLSVTYKDGAIDSVSYDAIDENGNKKSALSDEEYGMLPPDNVPISEWLPKLNENIKAAGAADKIEAVAGATNASNIAKTLMAEVEKQAKKGDTTTAIVEIAEQQLD